MYNDQYAEYNLVEDDIYLMKFNSFGVMQNEEEIEGIRYIQKYIPKIIKGKTSQFWEKGRQSVELTIAVLHNETGCMNQLVFQKHFHWLISSQVQGYISLISDYHQGTLQKYINQQKISQPQALNIFDQVLKTVYSLYFCDYLNANVRPEQFVKVGQYWKLESLVYDMSCSLEDGRSQYLWDRSYQAPQCYDGLLGDDDYNAALVFNLGAFIIHLLFNANLLNLKSKLNKYKGKAFSLAAVGLSQNLVSSKLSAILSRMLHHNPAERMLLTEVFACKLLSADVALHCRQNQSVIKKTHPQSSVRSSNSMKRNSLNNNSQSQSHIFKMMREIQQQQPDTLNSAILKYSSKAAKQQTKENIIKQGSSESQTKQKSQANLWKKTRREYANEIDRILILDYIQKQWQILPTYDLQTKELLSLGHYAIDLFTKIQLSHLSKSIDNRVNYFKMPTQSFNTLIKSADWKLINKEVNKLYTMALKKDSEPIYNCKFLQDQDAQQLLRCDYRDCKLFDIKLGWRTIMQRIYTKIAKLYFQARAIQKKKKLAQSQQSKKLVEFIFQLAYCLCIEKAYAKDQIEESFKMFFEQNSKLFKDYIPYQQFKAYIKNSTRADLKKHARFLLQYHFQIPEQK